MLVKFSTQKRAKLYSQNARRLKIIDHPATIIILRFGVEIYVQPPGFTLCNFRLGEHWAISFSVICFYFAILAILLFCGFCVE